MATQTTVLEAGMQAPGFDATDEQGKKHTLSGYAGQTLVLCFIPAQAPGLARRDFHEAYPGSQKRDIFLLGVMVGTPHAVGEFKRHVKAPFPILCDDGRITAAYGVTSVMNAGRNMAFFAIGPDGALKLVLKHARNPRHVYELLGRVA